MGELVDDDLSSQLDRPVDLAGQLIAANVVLGHSERGGDFLCAEVCHEFARRRPALHLIIVAPDVFGHARKGGVARLHAVGVFRNIVGTAGPVEVISYLEDLTAESEGKRLADIAPVVFTAARKASLAELVSLGGASLVDIS